MSDANGARQTFKISTSHSLVVGNVRGGNRPVFEQSVLSDVWPVLRLDVVSQPFGMGNVGFGREGHLACDSRSGHREYGIPSLDARCFAGTHRRTIANVGVVVQLPLLLLQLFTGYRYFRSVSGASDGRAILYALTLVAYPAVFHFNGGLGDFRMDLSQAYGYGAFLAALLLARKKESIWEWVAVGVIVAIVSLFRATTPVYVVIVTCFALLLDLRERGMRASVVGYLVMGITVAALAGWFFIGNYDFLHYYYAVWNTDANARLPLLEAIRHIHLLSKHIGLYLLSALLLSVLAGIIDHMRYRSRSVFRLNWVALIGGLVPITYLVLSGAGLNPFVSMVSVPGLIVFMLQPIDSDAAAIPMRYTRFVPLAIAL
ncbi:MAG: hypothetical protein IPG66_16115 [Hydrogenophilales bacterium]|nr:hypothetical protein [Hydrogenophilales bacterium]